jgi:hypothetical protein
MHNLALEVLQALDIRVPGLIQLPHRRDQEITVDTVCRIELGVFLTRDFDIDFPPLGRIVPRRFFDGRVEPDVFVELVLLGHIAEVVLY